MNNYPENIYILHGWAYDVEKWKTFIHQLELLKIDSKVLKLPGLTSPLDKAWSLNDYVNWLKTQFKNEKRVILLGHSLGGQIAIRYAANYPNQISKLVLIASSGIRDKSLFKILKRSIFLVVAKVGKLFTNSGFLKNILYKLAREKDYFKASPNMKKTMANILKEEVIDDLSNIKLPTCIIWGENDSTTPIFQAKLINSKIRNSELHILKNTKHSPQFSHPKKVAKIIRDFLL